MVTSWMSAFFTALLEPRPVVILFTFLVALTLPVLLHFGLYRSPTRSALPIFLLAGPSGAGKTSLVLLLEGCRQAETHTSQSQSNVEVALPSGIRAASSRYRSSNDPSLQMRARFILVDTPGHGKLRHNATSEMLKPGHVQGLIFVVDAADLSVDSVGLRDTAEYLHDLLLLLQKRSTMSKTSAAPQAFPVLIAANKADLFTALPAALVQKTLEQEISRIRTSKAKGLLNSGVGLNDLAADPDNDWLGDPGEGEFQFLQMSEANVEVHVVSGSTLGTGVPDIRHYWEWIGDSL